MNDPLRAIALAVAVLLIAWGVFGLIGIWWSKRQARRQRVAAYMRAYAATRITPEARRELNALFNRPWRVMEPDFSGTRNNPTADGGTDEGP